MHPPLTPSLPYSPYGEYGLEPNRAAHVARWTVACDPVSTIFEVSDSDSGT